VANDASYVEVYQKQASIGWPKEFCVRKTSKTTALAMEHYFQRQQSLRNNN
jgi:hypothetical protein